MPRNNPGSRILLGVIAVLLAANLLVEMNRPAGHAALAAGIPDTGAQNQQQIDQLVELNKKVDALSSFLQSGNLTVKVKSDKTDK
jgi:hypothetical protein